MLTSADRSNCARVSRPLASRGLAEPTGRPLPVDPLQGVQLPFSLIFFPLFVYFLIFS